ncbi:MAG: hypothetical protein ACM3KR_05605 [Deltaproteobacteria bacterium]
MGMTESKRLAVNMVDIMLSSGCSLEALEEEKIRLFCRTNIMPTKRFPETGWDSIGFRFGKEYDAMFTEAFLPKGWTKVYRGHKKSGRTIELRDNQNRLRGEVLFRPREAEYAAGAELYTFYYIDNLKNGDETVACLKDQTGKILYQEDPIKLSQKDYVKEVKEAQEYVKIWAEDNLGSEWNNPLKHWD